MTDPGTVAYLAKMEQIQIEAIAAREMDLSEHETLIRQKLGRARKVSLNRLRRAQAAEKDRERQFEAFQSAYNRAQALEAELRVEREQVQSLKDALRKAIDSRENFEASWRLKAEEWEEKYKQAVEGEARKWERAIDTWRTRYEDALRRLDRAEAKLRRAGIDE
jgi:DNA repair exonuclease SbcCD ATPase subunit